MSNQHPNKKLKKTDGFLATIETVDSNVKDDLLEGKFNSIKDNEENIVMKSNFLSVVKLKNPFTMKILIDTGAENINLISKSCYDRLAVHNKGMVIEPTNLIVRPINSKPFETLGKVMIPITLNPDSADVIIPTIIVNNLSQYDIIFGLPAITQLQIKLDIDKGIANINNMDFKLLVNNYSKYTEVRSKDKKIIFPGKEIQIAVITPMTVFVNDPESYHFVLPSSTLLKTRCLKMPLAVAQGKLNYITLANLSERSVVIKKNALLAYVVAHNPNSNLSFLTTDQFKDISSKEDGGYSSEDELIGDRIYIPNKSDKESLSDNEIIEFVRTQFNHLSDEQQGRIEKLILSMKQIYAVNPSNPGVQTKTKMHVTLQDGTIPIKLPPYRTSPVISDEIYKNLVQLLKDKLIEKSTSPWSFPVVVVKKGDGSYRFCVDYSKLTEKTIKDAYPLPRIDDTLDHLRDAVYFTVCDASSGFWQIPVAEDDKEKLAFTTTFGTYQWNVMPFGFTNAPAIFQRAIQETLDGELFIRCLVYIDDICIYSKTFEDHLNDIQIVFSKLIKFNWKLKLKKCQFAQTKIQYLGHIISHNQIEVHPKNVEKVKMMKRPTNVKELQAFLGSVNYYRRFIPNLSELTQPLLLNLRGKREIFIWNQEQDDAYVEILKKLCEEPVLIMPDYSEQFILQTDASSVGYGGRLAQEVDGILRPIAYFSGAFTKHERDKWNHWQKEALAVIKGIKRFDHYLQPKRFKLITDNESITTLINPSRAIQTQMITRWGVFLQSYDYELIHRPGKSLYIEDALSRSVNFYALQTEDIKKEQNSDIRTQILIHRVRKEPYPEIDKVEKRILDEINFPNNKLKFLIENDVLLALEDKKHSLKRVVIPESLEKSVLKMYHNPPNSGHLSVEKFYDKIKKHVWFPNLFDKVVNFKKDCIVCQKNQKFNNRNDSLHPIVATRPFELIQMDHCGPFPTTEKGNNYVLTIVDHFSRKRWFIPTKTTNAKEVSEALFTHIIGPFEVPTTILTDQGAAFTSTLLSEVTKFSNITPKFALTEQHDTVGSVERSNQVMEEIIRKYVNKDNQQDWDEYLSIAAHAINKSKSSSHGYSPDFLVFGREPRNPFLVEEKRDIDLSTMVEETTKKIVKATKKANELLADYRNRMIATVSKKSKKNTDFNEGNLVYMSKSDSAYEKGLSGKLDDTALGPYKIIKIYKDTGNVALQIAPETIYTCKLKSLSLANDQNMNVDYLFKYQKDNPVILPTKLTELIKISDPREFTKMKLGEGSGKIPSKNLTVKDLLNKRINVYWPPGRHKLQGWFKATVIGYNTDLKNSIVYYDERNVNVDPSIDYYSHNLTGNGEKWKLI